MTKSSKQISRSAALLAVLGAACALMAPEIATAASLVQVTNFGNNPTNLGMYLYVPNNVAAKPAILVASHGCGGSASAFYSSTDYAAQADKYGFIVIFPSANTGTGGSHCFDIESSGATTHNGNSDPAGVMSMVNYVLQKYNGDATRVFASGFSSGAMFTNVLMADYPDVFAGGAVFSGVPFNCMYGFDPTAMGNACSQGQVTKTASQWGDMVRAAYSGYSGARPRLQLWHGTADTVLNYVNYGEEIKQWTNVLNVSATPAYTDTPQSGWTRTRYGGTGVQPPLEGTSISGGGHSQPTSTQMPYVIAFFGLNGTGGGGGGGGTGGGGGGGGGVIGGGGGGGGTTGPGTAISIAAGATSGTGNFVADNYFSGGSTYTNTATVTPPSGVPAAVFNSERYGTFTYTLGGYQPNSSWTVTLYFAETYLTAAGQRSFDVAINGTKVLTGFDIYSAAGGANIGVGKSFSVTASSSGQIVIDFQAGSAENPKVDGIVVAAGAPADTVPPSAPTNLTASSVGTTSMILSWTASSDNVGVAGYTVYARNNLADSIVATPTGNSVSLSGLSPSTSYTYYVKARDAAGNVSAASSTVTVTTSALPDTQPPSTPTGLTVTGKTSSTVSLSWNASTDNFGVAAYDILSGSSVIGTTANTYVNLGNLQPNTTYTFSVRARDAAGNVSQASGTAVVTTLSDVDITPPSAPGNLTWAVSGGTVTLSWQPSTDDVGVVGYQLYYGSFFLGTFDQPEVSLIGFKPGTPYNFTVKAYDAAGNVSVASNSVTVLLQQGQDTTPPTAPTNLTATSVGSTSLSLRWTASTDDVGVVIYQVYVNGVVAGTVTSTSATVSNLSPSGSWNVYVKALDAAGNISQPSATLVISTAN